MYKRFYDTDKLCRYLNKKYKTEFTNHSIAIMAYKNGVVKDICKHTVTQSNLNYIQEKKLIKDYQEGSLTLEEICAKYGYKTRKSVVDKVKKHKQTVRSYDETREFRKTYLGFSLEKLDCDWKAYYIGLMLTDGWISKNRINLSLTDKDAIEFLCDKINVKYNTINRKKTNQCFVFQLVLKN